MYFSLDYIFSQIFVILYYIIYSYTYHLNDKNKILRVGIYATIINSISYILLNAYTGMMMCIVSITRNILFNKKNKTKKSLIIIIILTFFGSLLTYTNIFCLFNIIATLIYTYALWQNNTKTYKFLGIIVNLLMIIYNIYIKSFFGILLLIISFISSLIGYLTEKY